jgi:hypothetical protein
MIIILSRARSLIVLEVVEDFCTYPDKFHELVAQDVHPSEADIMAVVQKPFNQSNTAERSGPPAWKQLPTWYQVSERPPFPS